MTFYSNVAPPKIIRSKPEPWTCRCKYVPITRRPDPSARVAPVEHPGYLSKCNGCGMRRPS